MTPADAIKVAIEAVRAFDSIETPYATLKEAATLLERLAPFVDEFQHYWPMVREMFEGPVTLRDPWQSAMERIDEAYRALSTEETTKP